MNIYDVAKQASVSIATVSRVLNGSAQVRPATAARVHAAMSELSFSPNIFAQSLQTNSMRVLTVLTVDISDEYFAVAVQEIEQQARERGYDVQVSFARDDLEDQAARLTSLLHKRVDGIILAGSSFARVDNPIVRKVARRTPVALLNGQLDGEGIYSVVSDDGAGIQQAVDHLVTQGRRKLIYLQDSSNAAALAKARGYRDAAASHGIDVVVLDCAQGAEPAQQILAKEWSNLGSVEGIVCAEDPLAIGAIKHLASLGLKVPADVAVTGYDNLSVATYSSPELTSVDGRVRDVSRTVADVLIDRLEGGTPASITTFTPTLKVRASSLVAPDGDGPPLTPVRRLTAR
ncbi:LacI family DNA-binding transcriptional regulator [Microbacterium sp. AGC85]